MSTASGNTVTMNNGTELRKLFASQNPFNSDLTLKPKEERLTILAVNGNFPLEIQLLGFYEAAQRGGGSPMILQFSGGSLEVLGKGLRKDVPQIEALRLGAKMARAVSGVYDDMYKGSRVFLALDHFAVPHVDTVAGIGAERPAAGDMALEDDEAQSAVRVQGGAGSLRPPEKSPEEAREMLKDALRAARAAGVEEPSLHDMDLWTAYICSPLYASTVEGFLTVVSEMRPAWAMIDTEETPPVLNFAITRDIAQRVRALGSDALIEAEFGATKQSGGEGQYTRLTGQELKLLASQIAGFVGYTGAMGIAYPIGMEHAAAQNEKHEPDVLRLETVQREIISKTGRYVPFAQHGGTGASRVARGLVGKNNVNTHFLVTQAQSLLDHSLAHKEGILKGKKSSCGSGMYVKASEGVMEATVEKLKECGSYGILMKGVI